MFKSIMSFGRSPNKDVIDALYERIVAAARQEPFYSRWNVPDTPLGRFEMLSVHVFLFLERSRGHAGLSDVAQELTDEFFKDVEHSLRELGIGDLGVPKRMKKLAKMFYGRAESYSAALAADDQAALAAALSRNIWPTEEPRSEAAPLAAYVFEATAYLAGLDDAELMSGAISYPDAGKVPSVQP